MTKYNHNNIQWSGHIVLYTILISTEKFNYDGCNHIDLYKTLHVLKTCYMHGGAFDHIVHYNHDKLVA